MTATDPPKALIERLRSGSRYVLTSHINPDGDAVGSALGLARILHSVGKGAVAWLHDPVPAIYEPIPGSERMHSGIEAPAGFPESFDAAVLLECPRFDRCGLEERLKGLPVINIDHHLGNEQYGEVNWVDSAAPSLGEMIYRLGKAMLADLDQTTATILYMTLATDTGGFRFANSTARAFDAAARLVEEGAQPELVSQWIYDNQPEARIRLLAEMVSTLQVHANGSVASVVLTPEMFERAGANASHAEDLIDVPRSIAGVQALALLKEKGDGTIRVSLRSRGDIDVESIARRHNGGGHHNAAGFTEEDSLDHLRQEMVAALSNLVDTTES
ncbi:MAG TPA: bifunctional oligoribonuclease/PAP phosphatase NrnA [Thermoanaerobaculia bacterium]|nr:bifunctional oligoribonuclease/PAP phosphatase NrnA [Thermoanaerobaculia bacterium]